MDSALSLAPWELPPQTGAEAAGLADLRAMLAELSDASLERILFESAGDAATASKGLGAKPEEEPSSSPPSVVAEARRAGELDALLQKHLADVVNVEKLAWSGDGCGFRGGGKVSPSLVSVVASTAGGLEVAAAPAPSRPDPASPRSSIARWWASRKTVIGRKGRKLAKEAAAVAAAAAKEKQQQQPSPPPTESMIASMGDAFEASVGIGRSGRGGGAAADAASKAAEATRATTAAATAGPSPSPPPAAGRVRPLAGRAAAAAAPRAAVQPKGAGIWAGGSSSGAASEAASTNAFSASTASAAAASSAAAPPTSGLRSS